MIDRPIAALLLALPFALPAVLVGCTTATPDELAAKNRPLEERCARAQRKQSSAQPGQTREDIQAQAEEAQRHGELDKACDWL